MDVCPLKQSCVSVAQLSIVSFPESAVVRLHMKEGSDGVDDVAASWLDNSIEEMLAAEVDLVAAIDTAVELCWKELSVDARRPLTSSVGQDLQRLACVLLCDRHEFLDLHFYGKMVQRSEQVLSGIKIVVSSTSALRKVDGCLSPRAPSAGWPQSNCDVR